MAHFIKADGSRADVCGYAEAAYFAGFHFQHIAARDEAARLAGIAARGRKAVAMIERRKGGRAGMYPATGGRGLALVA